MNWKGGIPAIKSSYGVSKWEFLNIQHTFDQRIDWNCLEHGQLWCYHLNYFDFLHQVGLNESKGVHVIRDYIDQRASLKVGLDPYPTSLRMVNWVKYLAGQEIEDAEIDQFLFSDACRLERNIEYHLSGNHLLENAFAILFAAYYFRHRKWYKLAKKILYKQLTEQILSDGGHFELSPMYHQTILHRCLDAINLIANNEIYADELLLEFMRVQAGKMLRWISTVTFSDGSIP